MGTRVVVAALVPPKGDENRPLVRAVCAAPRCAGAEVVEVVIQRRGVSRGRGTPGAGRFTRSPLAIHPATLFGPGKAEEIGAVARGLRADAVVVCNDLTNGQRRNLGALAEAAVYPYRELPVVASLADAAGRGA